MKGNVVRVIKDEEYGFILAEDGNDYFFHKSALLNCTLGHLDEGSFVSFIPYTHNEKLRAKSITPIYPDNTEINTKNNIQKGTTFPGVGRQLRVNHLSDEERKIIEVLSRTFYVTNGGVPIKLGETSVYRFCLLKPTQFFEEQFNLNREIVAVFSAYENFEPRTFDAISEIYNKNKQTFRIERVCSLIISKDSRIVNRVQEILKNDIEMQVVVPFTYDELSVGEQTQLITNRFREHFYERDLFAFESPLKKDLYFFGRRDFIHQLINRHNSSENSGVFGLRRSGKTSILQAVQRALKLTNSICVFIDCQELYHFSWYRALYYVIENTCKLLSIDLTTQEEIYTEENASSQFSKDLEKALNISNKNILLLFDEIEQITPALSLSKAWRNGNDFIMFWQVIRSNFHNWGKRFTFILAGTNPTAIEQISVNGFDNPLFNQLKADSYIIPFNVRDTKEMVNKLGGYMGLTFDDIVVARLTRDFGGHPYLIRHFCSTINKYIIDRGFEKPIEVTSAIYNKVMPIFVENSSDNYCRFILDVLIKFYPEENKFLEELALGNLSNDDISSQNPQLISHLQGYGITENNNGIFDFKIDVLKKYLIRKFKYRKLNLTNEEKWAEISERRNKIEINLRIMIKLQLKSYYGNGAKQKVLELMRTDLANKYNHLQYKDLFDPQKCEVYFSQLGILIDKNWNQCFKNIFNKKQNVIRSYFTIINNLRNDCHAVEVNDNEMESFRGVISILEKEMDNYFD